MEITTKKSSPLHVLMVSFPGQGHINPLLRLGKILVSKGLLVTFSTSQDIGLKLKASNKTDITSTNFGEDNEKNQLRFEFFDDGWELDEPKRDDLDAWMNQLDTVGRESLTQLIHHQAEMGRPVSCIINNPFVPWVTEVAYKLDIPSAILWVQSCAVYSIYHHYYNKLVPFPTPQQKDIILNLPGLPSLHFDDIPSFLTINPFDSLKQVILNQFKNLQKPFRVLVDSFEELESDIVEAMGNISAPIVPVGPLFKSPDDEVRGDIVKVEENCLEWLDTQDPGSVIYISFGSIVAINSKEMEELSMGLIKSGLPFLWVVKPPHNKHMGNGSKLPDGFIEETKGKGLVVKWSPQEKVLAHPSLACFVTHCGWNSSMESLGCGIPVIAFPQWGDQVTNAKFMVDVYGVGVQMRRAKIEDEEMLTREEVERCIFEVTKGDKAEEIKKKALKWKKASEEAVLEGGSSYRNIQSFVDDIRRFATVSDTVLKTGSDIKPDLGLENRRIISEVM